MATLPLDPKMIHFVHPTVDTPFHIDYSWWEREGMDVNVQLVAHLCPEHREVYAGQRVEMIDWVDPDTCEVRPVDSLQYLIATHCGKQPGYITNAPTVVEAIFRVFLSNGNQPLSPRKLAPLLGVSEERILRILAGKQVHKGLRPVLS